MLQFPVHKVLRPRLRNLILVSALLVSGVLPATLYAADAHGGLSVLAENPVIDYSVISVLEQDTAAEVVITFDLPPIETSLYSHHPAAKTDVHPLLFELVEVAEPGTLRLERMGSSFALHARMSLAALRALGDNPDILAIELDPDPVVRHRKDLDKTHNFCFNSTTAACLDGRFMVTVNHGGSTSRRATQSGTSAVFWTFESNNWEILAKVINGCAVNGFRWVFAAGASAIPYSVTVRDTVSPFTSKTYSSTSFGNPVIDTAAFAACP